MIGRYRIGAIILARMDSRRLPGKVIANVCGQPLLAYVVARLPSKRFCVPPILATSDRKIDDPLVEVAQKLGLLIYRGDANDVVGRFLSAAKQHRLEGVLRLNGDSPFVDLALVNQAIDIFSKERLDIVTNVRPRSYPYGVSVELLRPDALESCLEQSRCPDDQEHITKCLYRNMTNLRHHCMVDTLHPLEGPRTKIRLTIDEPHDLAAFHTFVKKGGYTVANLCYEQAVSSGYFDPVSPVGLKLM